MASSVGFPLYACPMTAFVPAASVASVGLTAWRSPWRRRIGAKPHLAVQLEGAEEGEEDDIPNLLRVTPVPTYEEMLEWAEETDRRIAAGKLPPLGSRRNPSAEAVATVHEASPGETLLSDQEQAQMAALSELLSKRRRAGSSLSAAEEASLRAAVAGLSESVENPNNDGAVNAAAPSSSIGGSSDVDAAAVPDDKEAVKLVPNQVYGSREVRDKVYLYAWSLMKNRQDKAEREAAEQQEDQGR